MAKDSKPLPSVVPNTICISGHFRDRHNMILLINYLGWTYHSTVTKHTAHLVIGLDHSLDGDFIARSHNIVKAGPQTKSHMLFDFLEAYFPSPLKGMKAAEAGAYLFKKAWMRDYKGITAVALSMTLPWLFIVVDYDALRHLHRLMMGKKASPNVYVCVRDMFSSIRRVDMNKYRVTPLTRVEIFFQYKHNETDLEYAGFMLNKPGSTFTRV